MEKSINHIIANVLNEEASTEEIIQFSKWLLDKEENQKEFRELKRYWDADVSFNHTSDVESSTHNLLEKINRPHIISKKQKWLYASLIAASIALLIGTGSFVLSRYFSFVEPQEYFTYLTGDNKTDFTLEDGTHIYLNRNSKLIYSDAFDKKERVVKLEGEAYFDVVSNAEKPFTVELNKAVIKVLGTSFNVKTDDRYGIETTLVKGSIRFETNDQQVTLKPNQQLVFSPTFNQIEIVTVDINQELSWLEGLTRYKFVSFVDLMKRLGKRFEVNIVIQNDTLEHSTLSMSGSFSEEQSLEDILKIISITYPFKWEKTDNVYYIK